MTASRAARYALVAAVSILAHCPGLSSPLLDYHYHRQANTAAIARNYREDGLPFLRPRIDWNGDDRGRAATEFPLYMWLVGLLWPLFGLGELWGRLLSCLFSAAAAVLLSRFLEGWMEPEPAFWSGCLFSLLPVEIYFGRTVQPDALALFCGIACLHALDRALAPAQGSPPGKRRLYGFAAVIFCALSIGHKLPYAYLLAVCAALAWARRGKACLRNPRLWAFPLLVLWPVCAWYLYARSGAYVVPTAKASYWGILEYSKLPYHVFFQLASRFPELTATYPGLLLFALGVRELSFRRKIGFFAAWWSCVLAYVVLGGGYTFHHEYTALPWAPVNAAFMGMGLWVLRGKARDAAGALRPLALAGLAALVLGMPAHAALRIKHWYRLSHPGLPAWKHIVDRLGPKDDLFLCNERASSLYLFYIGRRGWSWDLDELGPGELRQVDAVVRKGAKFFLTEKSGIFLDPSHPITRYFLDRHRLVHDGEGALIFRLDGSND